MAAGLGALACLLVLLCLHATLSAGSPHGGGGGLRTRAGGGGSGGGGGGGHAWRLRPFGPHVPPGRRVGCVAETFPGQVHDTDHHLNRRFNPRADIEQRHRLPAIRSLLFGLAAFLQASNATFWLDWGTLLGAVRNQSIIPWDVDADVGITYEGYRAILRAAPQYPFPPNRLLIVRHDNGTAVTHQRRPPAPADFHALRCDRMAAYLEAARTGARRPTLDIPFAFVDTVTGAYIDVFLYALVPSADAALNTTWLAVPPDPRDHGAVPATATLSNRVLFSHSRSEYVRANNPFAAPFRQVFPLAECAMEGRRFPCPRNATHYLDAMYRHGGWRTPNPHWTKPPDDGEPLLDDDNDDAWGPAGRTPEPDDDPLPAAAEPASPEAEPI